MGLIGGIIQTIFSGFPCALMSPITFVKHPTRWVEAIDRYQATVSGGPNFAYELVLKHIDEALLKKINLSSWQVSFNGAEAIRYDTLTAFQDRFAECGFVMRSFLPCYGLAEATLLAAGCGHDQEPLMVHVDQRALAQHKVVLLDERDAGQDPNSSVTLIGCGEPVTDELCIVDPESKQLCLDQKVGEIWLRGDSVDRGYWRNSSLSQEVFVADLDLVDASHKTVGHGSFLRTGDLGFVYQQQLYVTGRLKELIIVNGRNHYPVDIDRTVQAVDSAFRTGCGAAFSVTVQGVEQLVLVQELRQERLDDIDLANALSQIKSAIFSAHRLTPFDIVLIRPKTLPKTTSGKIQRVATRRQYQESELASLMSLLDTSSVVSTQSLVNNNTVAPNEAESTGIAHPRIEGLSREKLSRESLGVDHYSRLIIELLEGLAYEVKTSDLDAPFVDLGLDSRDAVGMVGFLEDALKIDLDASIVFNYSSITKLAGFLAGEYGSDDNDCPAKDTTDDDTINSDTTPHAQQTLENEAMAIIGMACRFPGSESVDDFWQSLLDGVDAITEVPENRWDVDGGYDPKPATPGKYCSRWGGFLDAVDAFDANLFGISPKEAALMDPQQRLLLECSWHAIEDSGMNPQGLAGSNTGVFIGISSSDYSRLQQGINTSGEAYTGTGNAMSIAANRLSYCYDLQGPSMAIDTACSSSLVALHNACTHLSQGACDMALVGGVNLLLSPELSVVFSQARMLSPDGRCHSFAEQANGYVRGEGCGVLVIKPLSKAQQDGDTIWALIKGSAVNQDGRSNGLTASNGLAQQAVNNINRRNVIYNRLKNVARTGLVTSEGDYWKKQRRTMNPIFTPRAVKGFTDKMVQATMARVDQWEKHAQRGHYFELVDEMDRLTLEVNGACLFNANLKPIYDDMQRWFNKINRYMEKIPFPIITEPWFPSPSNLQLKMTLSKIDAYIDSLIAERKKNLDGYDDLLTLLLTAKDSETGESMPEYAVRHEVLVGLLPVMRRRLPACVGRGSICTRTPAKRNECGMRLIRYWGIGYLPWRILGNWFIRRCSLKRCCDSLRLLG